MLPTSPIKMRFLSQSQKTGSVIFGTNSVCYWEHGMKINPPDSRGSRNRFTGPGYPLKTPIWIFRYFA